MAGGVAVDVFGVYVGAVLNEGLDDAEVTSDACDVKRCSEVVSAGIDLGSELDEDLNHGSVSFTCSQMERSKSI